MNVLLGVTGSVAAKLTPRLVEGLGVKTKHLKVVATEKSFFFWRPVEVCAPILRDSDEWKDYQTGMPVLHIDLRNWADILLIAPLTANSLAKIANGFADNLLTSVVRAWDLTKPIILAPAMNTQMWDAPITKKHLAEVACLFPKSSVVHPVTKMLACGENGMGAMAPIESLVEAVFPKGEPKCAP